MICDDKAGLSDLLEDLKIPHISHKFFANPTADWYYSDKETDRAKMLELLKNSENGVVVKDNRGTGGINVYKAVSEKELLYAAEKIFAVSPGLAISPFINIKHEYRVLMLGEEFCYAFEKIRKNVTGNGKDSIDFLIEVKYGRDFVIGGETGKRIPENGEIYYPEWRHNLGQGAFPELVKDGKLIRELKYLAEKCMSALNLGFASVDIIEDEDGLKVLEINSGVMIDNFSAYSDEYYSLSKSAVKKAIELCLL